MHPGTLVADLGAAAGADNPTVSVGVECSCAPERERKKDGNVSLPLRHLCVKQE